MGDGRVINVEPRSLKKIHFFDQTETRRFGKGNGNNYEELEDLLDRLKDEYEYHRSQRRGVGGRNGNYHIKNNRDNLAPISIYEKKGSGQGPHIDHIDGLLLDYKTSELMYFVAKRDVVGDDFDSIVEGSRVRFTDEFFGICEPLFHEREDHKKILGEIDLHEDDGFETAVVRFVEIISVSKKLKAAPNEAS